MRPRRNAIATSLIGDLGLMGVMGLMGLMGVVVVSWVVLLVAV